MEEGYVIVDGYTDEPAGLGVPPYLDVYPRYVAGAIWSNLPSAQVIYFTIDEVRRSLDVFLKIASKAKAIIFIAGVSVPGKYLGGTPISLEELEFLSRVLEKPVKILGGPVAIFGIGKEGGRIAELPSRLGDSFDLVVRGDIELAVYRFIRERSLEKVDPYERRTDFGLIDMFAVKGAKIVLQHPNYSRNLIIELETFRGCPRAIVGGCSFCIEPLYGKVIFRSVKGIAAEVKALYSYGVKCFRLGRQTDIYSYMAHDTGKYEFPKPNPRAVELLFKSIRNAAPNLKVLHIDNANPGTLANHPTEARKITKIIVKYHTPGDVAALGVESADPKVIKLNNLKASPEESLEAVRIINEMGARRGYNGLPHLLPGINFVFGLIGETKETYILNYEFLKRILEEGLLVRRINLRQVLVFPRTRMWDVGTRVINRNKQYFKVFKEKIRKEIDLPMFRRVVPRGTILREVYTEAYEGKNTLARQIGSYPILVYIPDLLPLGKFIDVLVIDHGYRSVTGVPYPLNVNKSSRRLLEKLPGISQRTVAKILVRRPFKSLEDLRTLVREEQVLKWLRV
ncbi:MAG: radical SAM protein [Thermoprotei archaeon]|nr:MAG: radical SAM protein [Thermoprotei archaeon]